MGFVVQDGETSVESTENLGRQSMSKTDFTVFEKRRKLI
jgi:hypothetical protein